MDEAKRTRIPQAILIITFVGFCWLMMQVAHEFGHISVALLTSGSIENVVLYPTAFSRTEVAPNPHPLVEVWAGPIVGVHLPVVG